MSYRLYQGDVPPANFTAGANSTYQIAQDIPIMRNIAQSYAMYYSPSVFKQVVKGTPSQIIDRLRILREPVDLGIYNRNKEGHSLLGYGVEDKGNGIFWIMVYDNNWPGRTDLYVEVNYNAETWRYSLAATNPTQDTAAWEGDAQSRSLEYIPLSAYHQTLDCPFCATSAANGSNRGATLIALNGTGSVLVNSPQGQIGESNGNLVNTIPGADLLPSLGARFSRQAPYLVIPQVGELTIQATTANPNEPANLSIVDPGFSVSANQLSLQPNQQEQLIVSPADQRFKYIAGGNQQPVLQFVAHQGKETYLVSLSNIDFRAGQGLNIASNPTSNNLVITSNGVNAAKAVLTLIRINSTGQAVFVGHDLPISAGGAVGLDVAGWNGTGPLNIQIDVAADGTFEKTQPLQQDFPAGILTNVTSVNEAIQRLKAVAPYLNNAQKDTLLHTLAGLSFDGNSFGRIVFNLNQLNQLSDAQLVAFIKTVPAFTEGNKAFSPSQLAAFLFALRRDQVGLQNLIGVLGLSSSAKEQLVAELAKLKDANDALIAWDYLNQDKTTLADFLASRHLSPAQLGYFIQTVNLSPTEAQGVLAKLALPANQQQAILSGGVATNPAITPTQVVAVASTIQPTATLAPIKTPTTQPTKQPTPTSVPSIVATTKATPSPEVVASAPTKTPKPSVVVTPSIAATPSVVVTPSEVAATPSAVITPSAAVLNTAAIPTEAVTPSVAATPSAVHQLTPTAVVANSIALACEDMKRAVIAFYYAWYDPSDWSSGKTSGGDVPDPSYSGDDDATLNRHLQQASDAGIDVLACAWKGPGDAVTTNRCKRLLELADASGRNIKVAMFADEAGGWFSGGEDGMVAAIELLKNDFMTSPAYYKVKERPVFLAWRTETLGDVALWQRVRGRVDPDKSQFWMAGTDKFNYLDTFDTLFYYDISWESKPGAAMASYANRLATYNKAHPGANKLFVGTSQPSYDDSAIRGPGHVVVPHTEDGAYYRATWQAVINRNACAVVLTSFNEFYEGSYIEPSVKFGHIYLDLTGQLTRQYKGGR
jgi:hypothetical protein